MLALAAIHDRMPSQKYRDSLLTSPFMSPYSLLAIVSWSFKYEVGKLIDKSLKLVQLTKIGCGFALQLRVYIHTLGVSHQVLAILLPQPHTPPSQVSRSVSVMTRRCPFRIGSQLPYHRNQVENFKCSAGKSTAFARLRDGF